MSGYQDDLAFIHESGFTRFARGAASVIIDFASAHRRLAPIVDLGCGGGTLEQFLVAAELDVVGYDISESFIRMARERVPQATFANQSCWEVEFNQPTLAVAAIGEVFNYLFVDDVAMEQLPNLFRRIHQSLIPGGLFLFDVAGPQRALGVASSFAIEDDWVVLVENEHQQDLLTRKITAFRGSEDLYRRSYEQHRLRLIDPDWVQAELQQAGFAVERPAGYGDLQFPPGLHGFRAIKTA